MNAKSRAFYSAGVQRLQTARLICHRLQAYLDARYLAGYAAECALKSLLFERTPVSRHAELEADFRRPGRGHNVEWLLEQLVSRVGENVPIDVRRTVGKIRTRWDVALRYQNGRGRLDEAAELIQFCEQLLEWTKGRLT